jgi:CP family cyanate transporter-like MFS transporter
MRHMRETTLHAVVRALPLVVFSLTLRPMVTSVGPVLPEIRDELHMSATQASLLTVAPVVCFAIGAFFVPRMLVWISPNHAVAAALLLMFIGGIVRLGSTVATLLTGTVICGIGAAIGNIMGGIITRRDFASRVGLVMGMYVGVMSISSSTAAMVSFPLAQRSGGWRPSLALWAYLAIGVLALWTVTQAGHRENRPMVSRGSYRAIARNPAAWWLVVYFGFQSTNFHSLAGWLPSILRDAGIDGTSAGYMVSLMILLGVPAGIAVPPLAARLHSQRGLVVVIVACGLVGLGGVMLAPTMAPWVWVSLLGLSVGSSFPLALTMVVTKSDSTEAARDLNAFMQSWGYVISALGPFALGALRDATGNWTIAVGALVVGTLVQLTAGLVVARPGHIHTAQ